jgi:hypothetical protein
MSFPSLIARCRTLGLVLLCAALTVLAGCAQPPKAPATPVDELPRGVSREDFAERFSSVLAQDEFYEKALGVKRDLPAFPAFKEGIIAMYTDPVVVDFLYTKFQRGFRRDEVFGELARHMFGGILRLDDDQGMVLLNTLGNLMGRLSPGECQRFGEPVGNDRTGQFQKLLQWLNGDETRGMVRALHQSTRAALTGAPLRVPLTREQTIATTKELERVVAGGPQPTAGNPCRDAQRLVQAINRLQGPVRTQAITFLLQSMGLSSHGPAPKAVA